MISREDNAAPEPAQLPELTSLRFLAAFAILVLHYRDLLGPMPGWLMTGIVGGQYGVTFFFILSGFILTYRYHDWFASGVSEARYGRFLRLRFARIYPVYLLGLLLDTPWHLIERAQAGQLAEVGQTYWASWLLNLVGLQAWVPAVPFAMFWNTPAWSISAEFFFYATFPFLMSWLARRSRSRRELVLIFGACTAGGVALYAAVIYGMNYVAHLTGETQYIVTVYNPLLRYSEFAAGCLAGQWYLHHASGLGRLRRADASGRRLRDLIVVVCLAIVAARVWMPSYTGPSAGWWLLDVSLKYGAFIVPFTGLILAVASGPTCLSGLLSRPWMVLLGEASYSLYIIHWSLTTFLRMGYLGQPVTLAVGLACLLATVVASVLCYRQVELPWRRRLRGGSSPQATVAAGAPAAS